MIPNQKNTLAILDSGLNNAGWNAAFDQDWLAPHAQGERPDLLRFHRSRPSASIGRHQAIDRELRLDYCHEHGIETVRRISGGGTLYLDESQQGVSLIIRRPPNWGDLQQILARFCAALAEGLARLGIHARYKAPNDLEIGGRKLASAFFATAGDSLLLHATLLLDADIKTMLEALRAPTEKLTATGLESARQRLITFREMLGEVPPDAVLQQALRQGLANWLDAGWVDAGKPGDIDESRGLPAPNPACIDWSDADDTALEALHKTAGSVLRVRFWPDAEEKLIARLQFAGDLHLHPADALERLQHALTGLPLVQLDAAALAFFSVHHCELIGFTANDVRHLLRLALNKLEQRRKMGLSTAQVNGLMVLDAATGSAATDILARASVMLLPYCAKPAWCKWRHLDGCTECGKCEVGDAYRLARERNMQVTSVTSYEHLSATLAEMKNNGAAAYVGACCSQFFVKRHHAFRDAGIPAVLMDISGANCYELKQEEAAYAGRFQAEARLDADMLRQVMHFVPAIKDNRSR